MLGLINSFFRILKVLPLKGLLENLGWIVNKRMIFSEVSLSKKKNSGVSISMLIWANLERFPTHKILIAPLNREMNPFLSLPNTCSLFFSFFAFKTWQWMKSESLNEPLRKPTTRKLAFSPAVSLISSTPCCLLSVRSASATHPLPLSTDAPIDSVGSQRLPWKKSAPRNSHTSRPWEKKPPWIYLASTLCR